MRIGDYVRTKKRGFQPPQIARIKSMNKDSGYHNQYYIELDHNLIPDYEFHIYEENIEKSSPNIIDLIEVGDLVRLFMEDDVDKEDTNIFEVVAIPNDRKTIGVFTGDFEIEFFPVDNLRGIVTHEQFESMEYKIC